MSLRGSNHCFENFEAMIYQKKVDHKCFSAYEGTLGKMFNSVLEGGNLQEF